MIRPSTNARSSLNRFRHLAEDADLGSAEAPDEKNVHISTHYLLNSNVGHRKGEGDWSTAKSRKEEQFERTICRGEQETSTSANRKQRERNLAQMTRGNSAGLRQLSSFSSQVQSSSAQERRFLVVCVLLIFLCDRSAFVRDVLKLGDERRSLSRRGETSIKSSSGLFLEWITDRREKILSKRVSPNARPCIERRNGTA